MYGYDDPPVQPIVDKYATHKHTTVRCWLA